MSTLSVTYRKAIIWRRLMRAASVPAAALAAVAVWLVAEKAAGVDLYQPAFRSAAPEQLSVAFAALVAALAAALGWSLLALLEWKSARASRLWLRAALAALLVSLAGPLSGHSVSAANRLSLVCMHLAAAAASIPLLYRTATTQLDQTQVDGRR
jgi:Family of unknown function (DUF6069)